MTRERVSQYLLAASLLFVVVNVLHPSPPASYFDGPIWVALLALWFELRAQWEAGKQGRRHHD
jgi:hypothetical protein